jgi:hypothetical protein
MIGSLVALVGFATSASATATVDLLWFTNGFQTNQGAQSTALTVTVGSPTGTTSETLTVGLYVDNTNTGNCADPGSITAGPCRLQVLAVSVDATTMLASGKWSVLDFQGPGTANLPNQWGRTFGTGGGACPQAVGYYSYPCLGWNSNWFSAASSPAVPFQNGNVIRNFSILHTSVNKGLPAAAGQFLLGVLQFHKGDTAASVGVLSAIITSTDAILQTGLVVPDSDITFNDATVINVPEPGSLSLLVLAVGGMMAAGRRLRS